MFKLNDSNGPILERKVSMLARLQLSSVRILDSNELPAAIHAQVRAGSLLRPFRKCSYLRRRSQISFVKADQE